MSLSTQVKLGELKKVAKLQRIVTTTDNLGFIKETKEDIATVRCKVEFDDRLIREIAKDGGVSTSIVKIFTFRFVKGITIKDFILYDGDLYELYGIKDIDDEGRFLKVWGKMICQ